MHAKEAEHLTISADIIDSCVYATSNEVKSVIINEGATHILHHAFIGMRSLVSVKLPKSLEQIDENVFSRSSLVIIEFSSSNNLTIRNGVLNDCDKLQYIVVPDKDTKIRGALQSLRPKIIEKRFYDKAYKMVMESFSNLICDALNVDALAKMVLEYLANDPVPACEFLSNQIIPRDDNAEAWKEFQSKVQSEKFSKETSMSATEKNSYLYYCCSWFSRFFRLGVSNKL